MRLVSTFCSVMLACALTGFAGCGGSAPPKPIATKAKVVASSEVNPNAQGRPSPVHVRIFQLRDDAAFTSAEFSSLVEKEQETLGASLVRRSEEDFSPGEERELQLNIAPETRMVGVVAELANYRNAQWRAVTRAPTKEKERILIRIERDQISIRIGR
jgi:type VI secretion system protein VasD